MMSEVLYVDACCSHQANKFSWAIVGENIQKGGSVTQEKINSGYCELYAVYKALQFVENTDSIITIFSDNNFVVSILNRSRKSFEWSMKYRKYHINKDFIRNVYELYHNCENVLVMKINRKDNKIADKLARSFKNW